MAAIRTVVISGPRGLQLPVACSQTVSLLHSQIFSQSTPQYPTSHFVQCPSPNIP